MCLQRFAVPSRVIHLQAGFRRTVGGDNGILRLGRVDAVVCFDVEEAAKLVSVLPVTEIKIHSLYIIKGTKLAKMYEKGDIKLLPPEEYAERVVLILSMLRPDIVVQRIVGRASANTLSVNGGRPWWEVKEYIEKLMRNRHIQQGSACNYLHGAAVRRFLHE